jgi:FkbM family methyltransferase
MLIKLLQLVEKYKINFKGILHVGAHECEELGDYLKYLPMNNILWVEGLVDKVQYCKNTFPGIQIEHAVVSDIIESVTFNRANNGQSSSILEFGLHKNFYPGIRYISSESVTTQVLKDILPKYNIDYNFLNLDIQGAELKALKGMEEYLNKVDYIYTEVNSDYVYENCALVTEIDDFLLKFNLHRVETSWAENYRWGDAFYIRK